MPDGNVAKPASPTRTFPDAASRSDTRANASGWAHGETLWSDAISQGGKSWVGPLRPLISSAVSTFSGGDRVKAAFMFAVIHMGKIRACDSLKYGCVNLDCAARTPISLPTWDQIGQICLYVSPTDQHWAFFKAAHKAAYKNLPLNPEQADACIAAIRNPPGGLWCGFRPRALLFGAVAALLRYNCFR